MDVGDRHDVGDRGGLGQWLGYRVPGRTGEPVAYHGRRAIIRRRDARRGPGSSIWRSARRR